MSFHKLIYTGSISLFLYFNSRTYCLFSKVDFFCRKFHKFTAFFIMDKIFYENLLFDLKSVYFFVKFWCVLGVVYVK